MTETSENASEAPVPPENPKNSPALTAANTIFDYVELFALTVFFILLATLFLFRHAVVDGNSMKNTLENGEHLIISDAFYTPKYGDIIVFESYEETGFNHPLIKRVIATEGQTVTIRREGVYVDGVLLDDPYEYLQGSGYASDDNYLSYGKRHDTIGAMNADGTAFTYIVGEDEVFVLGDNRFDSSDGRMFGPVSEDCILGRVLFRLTPLKKFGGVD